MGLSPPKLYYPLLFRSLQIPVTAKQMGCILQVELAGCAPFAFWPSPLIAFGSKQHTIGCGWECNLEKDRRRETEIDPVGRERYVTQTQRNWSMWDFLRTFGNQTYFVGRPNPHSCAWISRSFILGSHLLCQPFKGLLCPLLWLFQPLYTVVHKGFP